MDAKEPDIVISGQKLTESQALTVRVALGHFGLELNGAMGRGLGEPLRSNYEARLGEINELMERTTR